MTTELFLLISFGVFAVYTVVLGFVAFKVGYIKACNDIARDLMVMNAKYREKHAKSISTPGGGQE
jgi:hypothetical protein